MPNRLIYSSVKNDPIIAKLAIIICYCFVLRLNSYKQENIFKF